MLEISQLDFSVFCAEMDLTILSPRGEREKEEGGRKEGKGGGRKGGREGEGKGGGEGERGGGREKESEKESE